MPFLENLYLSQNSFNGSFDCGLLTPSLQVLWLDSNILSGPIPACALQKSFKLQELSLSGEAALMTSCYGGEGHGMKWQ